MNNAQSKLRTAIELIAASFLLWQANAAGVSKVEPAEQPAPACAGVLAEDDSCIDDPATYYGEQPAGLSGGVRATVDHSARSVGTAHDIVLNQGLPACPAEDSLGCYWHSPTMGALDSGGWSFYSVPNGDGTFTLTYVDDLDIVAQHYNVD